MVELAFVGFGPRRELGGAHTLVAQVGQTVDHGELKSAVWLARDEVPMPRRDTSSLTNAMITAFATGYDPYR